MKGKFKVYKHTEETWVVMNKHLQYDTGFNIHSGEFRTLEGANKFCRWLNDAFCEDKDEN